MSDAPTGAGSEQDSEKTGAVDTQKPPVKGAIAAIGVDCYCRSAINDVGMFHTFDPHVNSLPSRRTLVDGGFLSPPAKKADISGTADPLRPDPVANRKV